MGTLDQPGFLDWVTKNALGIFVIVVVVVVMVGMLVFFVKLWPGLTRFVMGMNALIALPETLEKQRLHFETIDGKLNEQTGKLDEQGQRLTELTETVAAVKHEVLPNSGGSLRDAVDKQLKTQKSIQGTVRSQGKKLRAIETSLELTQQPESVQRARSRAKLA